MNILASIICVVAALSVYAWADKNIRNLGNRWNKKTSLLFFLSIAAMILGMFDAFVFVFKTSGAQ